MELKVWVEGIQRIVCGVNEKTTCQDVVFALAHATGKTGRFTLIERWRNSERLLAPNEQPLKVLMKWGEHSNDVQFILQWSPLDSSTKAAGKSPDAQHGQAGASKAANSGSSNPAPNAGTLTDGNGTECSSGNGFSPLNRSSTSPLSPSTKALGFESSSMSGCRPAEGSSASGVNQGKRKEPSVMMRGPSHRDIMIGNYSGSDNNGSYNTGKLASSRSHTGIAQSDEAESTHRKPKDFDLSSPPPYRDPPTPGKVAGAGISSSASGSSLKELPPYRNPPPPNLNPTSRSHIQRIVSNHSPVSSNSSVSGSSSMGGTPQSGNRTSPVLVNVPSINGTSSGSTGTGNTSSSVDSSKFTTTSSHSLSSSSYTQPGDSTDSQTLSWKSKDHSLSNGDTSSCSSSTSTLASKQSQSSSLISNSNSPQYRDLIRLINVQREKLTSQQAELTQHDAEIMFWEGKAREQQRHMEFITKEISRLELVSVQHESQVISLSHLEDENELVANESEKLKTELSTLHNELSRCDNELVQCKQRIRQLMDELQSTQLEIDQRQKEWSQREATTLAEIERLKKELDTARRETDDVSDLSGSLGKEVCSLEAILADKKKQMERLVSAMKEANLQSLTIQPTTEEHVDGGTHYRSGSTRRMIGSPRQLENAAPTSKNPHGVWV